MAIAIVAREAGGADVLVPREFEPPAPGDGEVVVRVEAAGVNYIDIYFRKGIYPGGFPFPLGLEGAGVVEIVGSHVTEFATGDRVCWSGIPGSYASHVITEADRLVRVPPGVPLATAAAVMLQGLTAHYLVHSTYRLGPGHTCLVHAAAGGLGLLLCQMAKAAGARVIGTVSRREKVAFATQAGADHVILYAEQDFASLARSFTNGRGVDVVYDTVGRATWEKSLDALALRGMLVLVGAASGPVPPIDPQVLNSKGSLFLTRPNLAHYVSTRHELIERAEDVLGRVLRGELAVRIGAQFPLARAADAHRALESRETTGKVLLVVER